MNRNSIIGFLLIGAILIGFSWYNSKLFKEQEEERLLQQAKEELVEAASSIQSDTKPVEPKEESQESPEKSEGAIYKESMLAEALEATESRATLENDKVRVLFSSIGAQPLEVEIKGYYTYDSLDLILIKEGKSQLDLNFFAGQALSTSNFSFTLHSQSNDQLSYRLHIDSLSYIEYHYTLQDDSHLLDLEVSFHNMERLIPRNQAFLGLDWRVDMSRQEKGYTNERNYSTVVYKFPNSSSVENLGLRKEEGSKRVTVGVEWVAFQQQFFSAILVANENFSAGALGFKMYPESDANRNLMQCNAMMDLAYDGSREFSIPFTFYFGPNHFKTLKSYDRHFEKIVPLGGWLIGWINRYVIITMFDFLSRFVKSYGLIILILTVLIKLVISPLTIKSYLSSAKMRVLKPEIEKINAKYPKPEDAMKKQQETMALYNKTGVNMFGGCLPMLLQFPILFAMFRFFPSSFELRQQGFLWVKDLSAYDSILELPFKIPLYGDHVSLLALLMAASMFFYSRMNAEQMGGNDPNMAGMKFMSLYFMPLFLLILGNNFSSGLCYYYLLSNLFTMGQTWAIRKYFVDEEKILAQLKQKSGSAPKKKKSKFQERLDAAYKAQQEQMKNRK